MKRSMRSLMRQLPSAHDRIVGKVAAPKALGEQLMLVRLDTAALSSITYRTEPRSQSPQLARGMLKVRLKPAIKPRGGNQSPESGKQVRRDRRQLSLPLPQ
jgi:hypothetical protein